MELILSAGAGTKYVQKVKKQHETRKTDIYCNNNKTSLLF